MAFNPDEYLATKSSSFDPDEYLKSKTQEPTEKGGFFGSYKQSLKERVNTAAPAAQLYFGAGDQRAATDELLKFKDDAASVYKQTEFGDLGKAFKEGRYGDALGGTLDKFKEVAGSSLGSQTPAIAAGLGTRLAVGAGAAALGVAAAPAALLGTAAWGLTTLGSYIADNLARQKEEQDKKGTKYQDVNRLSATAAATGQTALDAFGFSYFKPLGRLVGFSGKESAEKATMEIVQAATNPNAYKKAVASGAAKGIAFEVPQEVTQSVLERWQAGLALNPFTDPEAAKEYLEAAGGALLLGGPMGAYSGAVNTYRARQTPEAEVMLRDSKSGAAQDIEGEGNVNQSIGQTGGTGTQVPGERGAGTATGTNIAESGGVDAAGQTPAGPAGGTAVQPGALNEPPGLMDGLPGDGTPADTLPNLAPQNVDEFAANAQQGIPGSTDTVSAKYGNETFAGSNALIEPPGLMDAPADTEEVSSAPGAPITQAVQDPDSLARLRDNYVALKDELTPILGRGDTRKADALVRDLQRMVDESAGLIGDPELIKNLKNPMFDGKSPLDNLAQDAAVASEPRAMQSNMFGKFINGAHNAQLALAHTGTTQGAIKFLQDKRRRLQNDLDTGKLDAAWAQKIGARFGMNQGESVKNYQQVAELYTQAAIAEVDAALNQLSEKKSTPKAMQSDMFGEKQKAPTVQAPDLVNNGRTLDLVIDGKVIKTYDLVSQGLWDAFKGRPEAQENLLQSAAAKKVKDEANEALKDADRIYSEQAPLSRVENDAIQALANNDTLLMKRIVTNLTIRDSVLRMLSSALSYPGQPYRDFSGLAAMSEYDSRAKLTAENILRYAPEYMLKNANIPAEFKFSKTGTPATSQNSVEDIIKTLAHVFGVLPKSSAYKSFVRISQTAEEAYKAANKKVPLAQLQNAQAFVDPSDSRVVHLIANNIPKGGEFAVLLHEVGVHVGLKNKLGENFKLLEAQVKAWANAPKSSLEFKVYEAAMARVAAARLDGAITSEIAAEELVAYAAEEAALAGVTVTKDTRTRSAALQAWIQQLNDLVVEALKNFLNVVSVPKLTTQDLVNFSYAAAQEHMESLRAEVGSSLDATDAQVSKYYAGSRGTAEGTVLDSQYGFGKEAFFWNPTDKFGSFTGIATRAFYERAESKGLGPRGVGSPAYMAMVLTSSESREFGEAQNNKQDKVLMTLQAVHEPKTNSWSLIVSGPELDGALYTDLFVNGLATKTKDNEGNEWTRLEGISRADNIRVLSEFRRRLTRIKNGEIPNIDFTRITGSGAALEEGNFKSYSADELAIRYSKAPNQGTIQRNIAKLPKASRSPVRNIVLGLGDLGGAGLDYVVFTSDLVKRAVAVGLTSAQTFADALAQRRARVSEFEREIERIADGYADIEPEFKGAGRGSVNDFLFESTRTLKWGYDSGKLKADPAMEIAFNKLGPKAQQFVKNVFAHGDKILSQKKQSVLNSANSEYDAMIQAAQDAVNAAQIAVNTAADAKTKTDAEKQLAERKQDLAEVKAEKVATLKRFQTLFAIREGKPYAPIKRDGAYVVIGKSAEYKAAETAKDTKRIKQLESDPDHYHVSFVDTKWAARTLSDNLTDQGVFTQPDIVQRATAFEETFSGEALLPALTKIRAAVDKRDDSNRSKMLNIVNQLYLEALAEGSARKSEMRRRGVAGEVDMLQSFTRQGRADANFLANVEFEPLIQDALQQMRNDRGGNRERKSEIFNELTKRYVDSLETKGNGFITGLTNTASKYFLASSPAYYMQNLTQPFMMSLPALAGRHDYTKAGKALFDAYAELGPLFRDVKLFDQQFDFSKVPADVRAAITKLVNQGQIDIGLATEINEYKVDADSKLGKFAQRLNKSMRLAVQKVEATNRLSTAIAAYRLELARLKKDPKVKNPEELATQYAADILTDTHGDYTAMNAPRIFNSQWGKVALQFRKFQLIQIAFYAKLLRDAFTNPAERAVAMRTLAFSLGHSAVFAGMMGLPGYAAVAFILKAFSDEDEPYDLTADMRQALGPEWSDLIMRGAPTLVGVDLSGKIGSGNMLSIMPFSDADLSTTAGRAEAFGTLVGGASLGMVSRVADGMGLILSGDYYKGIERTMPKGVSDALKAGRQAAEGMTRRNGDVVLPAEEISAISAILTGLGVPAVKETVTYERQNRMRDVTENFQERTTRVKNDYVRAVKDNDAAAKQSARDAWTKLQKARQENGLKLQPFSDLLKAPQEQAKRERMTIGGVQYTKGNRKLAEEIAGD